MSDPTMRPEYRLINVLFEMRAGMDCLHRASAVLFRAGHGGHAEDLHALLVGLDQVKSTVRDLAAAAEREREATS